MSNYNGQEALVVDRQRRYLQEAECHRLLAGRASGRAGRWGRGFAQQIWAAVRPAEA
jgi:hypothetical protein